MKKILLIIVLTLLSNNAFAAPIVGESSPKFTATDTNNVVHNLDDFKGKIVILEWTNHECPYVIKHYDGGHMQSLQKEATDNGIIWLSVVSSAPGKQGHTDQATGNQVIKNVGSHVTARLLDETGEMGRLYAAKTTPHMFVINQEGTLVYAGAIDSDPSFKPDGIATATNYVKTAWNSLLNNTPIEVSSTQPYGCSVKY